MFPQRNFPLRPGRSGAGEKARSRHRLRVERCAHDGRELYSTGLAGADRPFGISDSALSLVMTVFTAPAIFLSPIFGVVADLYGRRLLLGWGLIVFGLFGTSMAFAPSFTWLLVLRTLQESASAR